MPPRPLLLPLLILVAAVLPAQSAAIPAPEAVLGFAPGTDGMLADYRQIREYFEVLAATSERVRLETLGETTEGRPLVMAIITSPANHARLEEIRAANLRLADPRKIEAGEAASLIRDGKVIAVINESIHSTEVGPAQAGMVTAHFLATTEEPEWLAVLDDVVTLLVPCHNPDGYATTVDWWRQTKGSKEHRGARLPVLYHKYVGHDNNRDWFMLTQAESRVTVEKVHMAWRPQIVVDQHQMGSFGARMFIPPYQEPYEPNVHPLLREGLDRLGRDVIAAMAAENLRGVICNSIFDAWTPARAFMHYHGAVRVLTEVASCQIADPIENMAPPRRGPARTKRPDNPAPWKGGRWALGDIVTYCSRGALHALAHAARNRETWLRNFHRIHADECAGHQGPDAFLIPRDQPRQSALSKLRDIFELGGVEIEALVEPAEIQGRTWPAGTLLIRNRQPYACFARALLQNTPYPEIRDPQTRALRRPYDVTSHCLPLLMNLEVHEVPRGALPSGLATALAPNEIQAPATASAILLDPRDEGSQVAALRALSRGAGVERCLEATGPYPAGALLLRDPPPEARAAVQVSVPAPPDLRGQPLRPQRIGIYGPWLASMDEGWTRFLLDHFEIPFTHLRPADLRAGGLERRIDILVIADIAARDLLHGPSDRRMPQKYLGGIGEVGSAALRTFVRAGGTLITLSNSSDLALQLFDLDIERVPTRNLTDPGGAPRRFNLPGCVLMADVDTTAFPAWGCAPRTPIFFSRAGAFRRREPAAERAPCQFPVRYATEDLVAGGYAEGAGLLAGQAALATARVGKGQLVLFAFSPQFRCQTWSTFPLFLNALLGDQPAR